MQPSTTKVLRAALVLFGVFGGLHVMERDGPTAPRSARDWTDTGFDSRRVAQLVAMSKQAYQTSAADRPTEYEGYRLATHYHEPFTLSMDVWHDDAARDVVVAFSGTPPQCVRSIAKSLALVWKPPVRIVASSSRPAPAVDMCTHRYVLTGLRLLLNRYREGEGVELAERLAGLEANGTSVTFTGHSRGGVAAMLMAHYEMAHVDGGQSTPAVLAVSAPPTFCSDTVGRLAHRANRTLSVARAGDPVTGLQHASEGGLAGLAATNAPGPTADGAAATDPDHACHPEFRHLGVMAEFTDGGLVAVERTRRTTIAGSSLDLNPHSIDGIVADSKCLARD